MKEMEGELQDRPKKKGKKKTSHTGAKVSARACRPQE